VHTLEEINRLHDMFPKQIECVTGMMEDEVVAGVVLFCTPQVVHAQYIGSSTLGQELGVPTAVLEHAIEKSKEWGARYFDFGISTEDEGRTLNSGLHRFKGSFGAGTVLYESYELDLEREVVKGPNR
jgi:lipid II:glycine glycyltransferase (peptidoglycan interpeptide bridge formation enzyme)